MPATAARPRAGLRREPGVCGRHSPDGAPACSTRDPRASGHSVTPSHADRGWDSGAGARARPRMASGAAPSSLTFPSVFHCKNRLSQGDGPTGDSVFYLRVFNYSRIKCERKADHHEDK